MYPPMKIIKNYVLKWMGLNLYDYDGLQPKISVLMKIPRAGD